MDYRKMPPPSPNVDDRRGESKTKMLARATKDFLRAGFTNGYADMDPQVAARVKSYGKQVTNVPIPRPNPRRTPRG